jgi:hypothetical protein
VYLGEAFLLNAVQRYNLKGKKHLETNAKYYLGDIGLRNGVLGYREADIGGILENLVYLELRRRGYRVAAGSAESGGIMLPSMRSEPGQAPSNRWQASCTVSLPAALRASRVRACR